MGSPGFPGGTKNKLDKSIDNIVGRLHYVRFQATTRRDREAIDAMLERLTDGGAVRPIDELPTPREIAGLRTQGTPDLGAQVMLGSNQVWRQEAAGRCVAVSELDPRMEDLMRRQELEARVVSAVLLGSTRT